jgi:hydroxyacylglutathione hydrolase
VDETTPLVLVVEQDHLDEAVRDLIRIGYDAIAGYVTPDVLERYFEDGGAHASIAEITFEDVARMKDDPAVAVLDVRFASEYAAAHVPGAANASYTRLPDYVADRVPQGKTLLVHCVTGARSAAASAFLARQGFDVRYVNGAFADYASAYEVEEGAAVAA